MTPRRSPEDDFEAGPGRRRALDALAAAGQVRAPERLRRRVAAERARAEPVARRHRRGLAAAVAVIVAALAASALFLFPPGVSDPTVLREIAELHARAATNARPTARPPALLDLDLEGVAFPNFGVLGWRVGGIRTDRVHDRDVTTVFYRRGARRIGYSLVSGRPLRPGADAAPVRRGFSVFPVDGRTAVAFERSGLTGVISGRRVSAATLVRLASWTGGGQIIF